MRRALVDVDGTLVDLHRPLHAALQRLYPDIPNFYLATTNWNWYRDYVTDEQFYGVVDLVHTAQIDEPPLPGAQELFRILNERQFEIVVASHRRHNTADRLARWLVKNDLVPFSGVFTNHDKLFLVQPDTLVIDDAPKTIQAAVARGADSKYLAWPWNADLPGERYSDLYQLGGSIENED